MIDLVSDDENLVKKEIVLTSIVSEVLKTAETLPQKLQEGIILFQFNGRHFVLNNI
jgi:basic membrane lipoprotein Med (substrate-binding protein (PBP1-ABC) superfamily)